MSIRLHGLAGRSPKLVLFLDPAAPLGRDWVKVFVFIGGVVVFRVAFGIGDGEVLEVGLFQLETYSYIDIGVCI